MLPEKGTDLVLNAASEFARNNINLIIFGPNSSDYSHKIQEIKEEYNKNIRVIFSEHINKSQKEYAAADIVLMPSLYEPCGSNQMIGMRYGAIPVSRKTGGLIDGSKEAVEKGVGFTFDEFSVEAMMKAVIDAVSLITSEKHDEVIKTLLQIDNSWQKASEKYIELYKRLLEGK